MRRRAAGRDESTDLLQLVQSWCGTLARYSGVQGPETNRQSRGV